MSRFAQVATAVHAGAGVPWRSPALRAAASRVPAAHSATSTTPEWSTLVIGGFLSVIPCKAGRSAWSRDDAYGQRTVVGSPDGRSAIGLTTGYTGRADDEESGLMYFRNRMYSASEGRFVSRDPAGYQDGTSLYRAYQVPNATDPLGLCQCGPDVTAAVSRLLKRIDAVVAQMTPDEIGNARRSGWPLKWDIIELHLYEDLYKGLAPADRPSAECDGSVTFLGACWRAEEVNYVLYGHLSKLMNLAFDQMRSNIDLWTGMTGVLDPSNVPYNKFLMAQAAYNGDWRPVTTVPLDTPTRHGNESDPITKNRCPPSNRIYNGNFTVLLPPEWYPKWINIPERPLPGPGNLSKVDPEAPPHHPIRH